MNLIQIRRTAVKSSVIVMAAAIVGAGVPAHADETADIAALKAQITDLTARLAKIEAEQAAAPTVPAPATPSATTTSGTGSLSSGLTPTVSTASKLPIVVSGLLQVQSLNYFDQQAGFAKQPDTFRLRRGEITISSAITPRIGGSIKIDPAKVPGAAASTSILQEIQINYLLNKRAAGSNYVDVGQYKVPVGYESLQGSGNLQFVERALIFDQKDKQNVIYGDARDTGVQLRGNQGIVNYRLGVFNGLGDRQNATALSSPKAVIGWVSLKPKSVRGLEFGASGGSGGIGNSASAPAGSGPRVRHDIFNLFAAYKKNKLSMQTEYLSGKSELINSTGLYRVSGYYGAVGYFLRPRLEAAFRYDDYNSDRSVNNAEVRQQTLGLNYYLSSNAKIQTNIVHQDGGPGSPTAALQADRDELRTNFQVSF